MQKTSFGYIYKTTNTLNNMIYIGKKEGKLTQNYYGSGLYLKRAIKKHGRFFFKIEIIAYANNRNELENLEKIYIAGFRSLYGRQNLYNITDGGTGGNVWIGGSPSVEQRIKIGKASIGNKNHKDQCLCCVCKAKRFGRKGLLNPMFGKKFVHSEETKNKIRLSKIGDKNPAKRIEVKEKLRKYMLGRKRGNYKKEYHETGDIEIVKNWWAKD